MPTPSSSPNLKRFLKAILDSTELQAEMQNEITTERLVEIAANHGHQISIEEINTNALWQTGGFKFLY